MPLVLLAGVLAAGGIDTGGALALLGPVGAVLVLVIVWRSWQLRVALRSIQQWLLLKAVFTDAKLSAWRLHPAQLQLTEPGRSHRSLRPFPTRTD